MIGETILARTSAQCKQAYNWRDNISLIIGLQSASWWSVNIYCANHWPTIGAPIIVPPILARLSAVLLNSANPTWVTRSPNTIVTLFEDIFHFFYFLPEGPQRFFGTFLSFLLFSKMAVTLFEKIFKLFTFFPEGL